MPCRWPGRWVALLAMSLLAACEPAATPFPVDIPTPPTATPTAGPPMPVRYALAANTAGVPTDIVLVQPDAQITQLETVIDATTLGGQYDVIVALGTYPDATPAPDAIQYGLLVDGTFPPLDDPTLAQIIIDSIDPAQLTPQDTVPGLQLAPHDPMTEAAVRAALANAGWPDGLDLRLVHDGTFGVSAAQSYFQALNIQLELLSLQDSPVESHLSLLHWKTQDQRDDDLAQAGDAARIVDLYTLPISYWAVPGLNITYSPQGWPVATRP